MSIVNEKYSANRINLIHQMLVNDADQGQPRDYEIKVDELRVVQRTDDPERFFQHEEFVQPTTQCITISIFDGGSRRCTKYQLYFGEAAPNTSASTLSGIENTIKEKINHERAQWEYEQIKKENENLEKQLTDAEEYSEELEKELMKARREFEEFKQKRVGMSEMNAGKMIGFAADYLVKNHPSLARKVPILSGLSGYLSGEEVPPETLAGAPTSETSASFSKKEPTKAPEPDPEIEARLDFFKQMEDAFPPPRMEKVIEIIQQLSYQPHQLDTVYELLCAPSNTSNNPAQPSGKQSSKVNPNQ